MRKIVILGSILICFLMLMIPHAGAIQYNTVSSSITKRIKTTEKNMVQIQHGEKLVENKLTTLIKTLNTMNTQQSGILGKIITILLWIVYYPLMFAIHIINLTVYSTLRNTESNLATFLGSAIVFWITFIPNILIRNIISSIGAWNDDILLRVGNGIQFLASLTVIFLDLQGVITMPDIPQYN